MKKILLVINVLLLSVFIPHNASAVMNVSTTEAQIIQAYCLDSSLYAYVNIPEEKDSNALITKAVVDGTVSFKQSETMVKVTEASSPVSYLFLVDISTSMPKFKDNINTFISSFMSDAGDDATFAVATLGTKLEVICDFTDNRDEINTLLAELKYDVKQTSLYKSIINAVDYLTEKKRQTGELYNIVVITDGIEYDKKGVTIDEVYAKLRSSPVVIHTFGLPVKSTDADDIKESEEALKVLGSFARTTYGVHAVLGYDNNTEAELTKAITGFVNNLYVTKYDITGTEFDGGSHDLKIVFATTGQDGSIFNAGGTLNIPYPEVTLSPEEIIEPQATTAPGTTEPGTTEPGPTAPGTTAPGTTEPGTKEPEVTASPDEPEESSSDSISDSGDEASEDVGVSKAVLAIIISGAVILLAVILIVVMILRKKKHTASQVDGVFMKVEILSDNCTLKKNELYLTDNIYIGRDKDCDIRLKNKDVSKKNSKLYVRDNVIYIEDMNSTNGTAINNMKIFSPNKLRSGDVISIGSVAIVLKF